MTDKKIDISKLNHGRETYAVYYGENYVLKRPLPTFGDVAKDKWLEKQHKTKTVIDEIRAIENPVYNIPSMTFINDEEYQILEERAQGIALTKEVYSELSPRHKTEFKFSFASLLVDTNESKQIYTIKDYNICCDINTSRLIKFIDTKMSLFFSENDIRRAKKMAYSIIDFSYDAQIAWSHGDLNPNNIFFDNTNGKTYIIDWAEAKEQPILASVFSPIILNLGLEKEIYEMYYNLHNHELYDILRTSDPKFWEIQKQYKKKAEIKRFLRASEDLRIDPKSEKSVQNNKNKMIFMRQCIANCYKIEHDLNEKIKEKKQKIK